MLVDVEKDVGLHALHLRSLDTVGLAVTYCPAKHCVVGVHCGAFDVAAKLTGTLQALHPRSLDDVGTTLT